MMKIKTSELQGAVLDWAVAKCEEFKPAAAASVVIMGSYNPSTNWEQGGPIIERENIILLPPIECRNWVAGIGYDYDWSCEIERSGTTPLIAAMRCYVASRLGDEVEVPNELCEV